MSSVNTFALGMGDSDLGGSIRQLMVDYEVIPIDDSSKEVLSPANGSISDRESKNDSSSFESRSALALFSRGMWCSLKLSKSSMKAFTF